MRFNLMNWASLIVVSGIASAVASLPVIARTLGGFPTNFAVVVLQVPLSVLLEALALWLILRRCVDGLRLTRWLLASVLGLALWLALGLLSVPLLGPQSSGLSQTQVLLRWLITVAATAANYLPPGLLLQRLSGISAWPFILAGVAHRLIIVLLGNVLMDTAAMWSLVRPVFGFGPAGVAAVTAAVGFGLSAISGMALGAGLLFMARRNAPLV